MIGDWMGSAYDVGGRRFDYHLFLDHDGRYEWTERNERNGPQNQSAHRGRWFHDEAQQVLRLEFDKPEEENRRPSNWWVLSVRTCEDSNCILVLREAVLASRNLPVLFYRVHIDHRGYGTGSEQRLNAASQRPACEADPTV